MSKLSGTKGQYDNRALSADGKTALLAEEMGYMAGVLDEVRQTNKVVLRVNPIMISRVIMVLDVCRKLRNSVCSFRRR